MMPIYLVCGVPGSGKTWVCERVADKFLYLPHDQHKIGRYAEALLHAASLGDRPILGEAPFRISILIDELTKRGARVLPYFVIENAHTVKARYEAREKKNIPPQHITRIRTVVQRARQYRAPNGTSEEILKLLEEVDAMADRVQEGLQ